MARSNRRGRWHAHRREILYVEDSAAETGLLRESLPDFPDLLMTSGSNGAAALAYLRDHCGAGPERPRPDLVLLDLNLPYLDGRRVLADIKRDPAVVRAIYEFWCGAAALPASHWRNDD